MAHARPSRSDHLGKHFRLIFAMMGSGRPSLPKLANSACNELIESKFLVCGIFKCQMVPGPSSACQHRLSIKNSIALISRNYNPRPTSAFVGNSFVVLMPDACQMSFDAFVRRACAGWLPELPMKNPGQRVGLTGSKFRVSSKVSNTSRAYSGRRLSGSR